MKIVIEERGKESLGQEKNSGARNRREAERRASEHLHVVEIIKVDGGWAAFSCAEEAKIWRMQK